MANKFKVRNLTEALELGRQFSVSGEYNLFRGQGQNWRVKSTMARLNKVESAKAIEQLKRLHYYFQTHKPLEKFVSDIDWFYAVAQHYGFPTNYIDFSHDVNIAAYFATNSKSNRIGEDCVIICLQETDFTDFVKITKSIYARDKVLAPYIVKPNVDNLWRLQAQQGCFIYTPYEDIEFYYDFDKIIFPFSEQYQEIPIEHIYPKRKSELEILLDHYFNTEEKIQGQERFRKFIEETNILHTELPPLTFNGLLKNNTAHGSWQTDLYKNWMFKIDEQWSSSKEANVLDINFTFKKSINEQIEEIFEELSLAFGKLKINRNSPLKFNILAKPKQSKRLSKTICVSCARIWDGTRNLPFTENEILLMIAKYVCLEIYENKIDITPSMTKEELITLELANEYGSITRCHASPSKIILAFRDDLDEIISESLKVNISSRILLRINKPDLLFDFNRLIDLFKDEIIPYQVLYNSEKKNPVIFYTPTQITVMGYA